MACSIASIARVLTEEIRLGRDDDVCATAVAAHVEAADDRDRNAVELAEDELGRSGDLVSDGFCATIRCLRLRSLLQLPPEGVRDIADLGSSCATGVSAPVRPTWIMIPKTSVSRWDGPARSQIGRAHV